MTTCPRGVQVSRPDPFEFFGEGMAGVVFAVYEPDFFWGLRHGFYPVDEERHRGQVFILHTFIFFFNL
jgi:hypothetical protein